MGQLTGEFDPVEVVLRVLTSEGDLGEGMEDEKRRLGSASFRGLLEEGRMDPGSGLVDLGVTLSPLRRLPWKRVRCPLCNQSEALG